MEKQFFADQVERLKKNYYADSFTEDRIEMLWKKFKNVPNHVFENAVNWMISEYTSKQLPAISKFAEAVGLFRTNAGARIDELPCPFGCEACRDMGFGFVGDTVTRCTCPEGEKVTDEAIAKHQRSYNTGRKFFLRKGRPRFMPDLPYDPNERVSP